MVFRLIAVACLVVGGCGLEQGADPGATGEVEQGIQGNSCPPWMCGTNSPAISNYGFWELNLAGLPNSAGMVVDGFYKNGFAYTPRVWAGKLTASRWIYINGFWLLTTLSGQNLVGGYFLIHYAGSGTRITLDIDGVQSVTSWAQPNPAPPSPVTLESYLIDYTFATVDANGNYVPGHYPTNVCSNPPHTDTGAGSSDTLGQNAFSTLLFEGDRIDPFTKTVNAPDNSWFNLGCAGHTLAKMALTAHTEAAVHANTITTSNNERNAMLKMLVADYCGDGTTWTVTGQPLTWADAQGTMKLIPPPTGYHLVLESRWNYAGAVCLNVTRVNANNSVASSMFPSGTQGLLECQIPSCSDPSISTIGYHLISATPAL